MESIFLKKNRGFTLIEILIVISIIGTLALLGLASYTATLKNGRNARRRSDMKAMQNAWEQYYADNTAYPSTCAVPPEYLPAGNPIDPTNSVPYVYNFNCSLTTYRFCATLEPDSESQYCVYNLQ